MSDEFPYDVFVSHSAKDKAVVRPLAERLRKDGLRVWFDEWEIRAGDSIESPESKTAKIEEGLERSRVLVLCMSANAFGSDWAQLESGTFRFRDPLNKERGFFPLRLDDAPIKGSLAQFPYINWLPAAREREYAKLIDACRPKPSAAEGHAKAGYRSAESSVQIPYSGNLMTFAVSADGKSVIAADSESPLAVWDTATGRCLQRIDEPKIPITNIVWSANRCRVISGNGGAKVELWDIRSRETLNKAEFEETPSLQLVRRFLAPFSRRHSGWTEVLWVRFEFGVAGRCCPWGFAARLVAWVRPPGA